MARDLRVAAIDVSHWHARYDAAWLPVFRDLGATFVGMSDVNEAVNGGAKSGHWAAQKSATLLI